MREVHNIAIFGHKRIPSREGGVEIVVEELGTRLVQKGYHVTCFNRRGHHVSGAQFDKKAVHEYKGIDIRYVFTIEKKGFAALTASFFAALRTAFGNYDVVPFMGSTGPVKNGKMAWHRNLSIWESGVQSVLRMKSLF